MNADLVHSLYMDAQFKLLDVMKELKFSFGIDVLCKIRHDCYKINQDYQNRTQLKPHHLQPHPQHPPVSPQFMQLVPSKPAPSQTTYQVLQVQPSSGPEISILQPVSEEPPMQAMNVASNHIAGGPRQLAARDALEDETMSQDSDEGQLTIAISEDAVEDEDNQDVEDVELHILPTTTITSEDQSTVWNIQNDYDNSIPMYLLTSTEPVTIEIGAEGIQVSEEQQVCCRNIIFFFLTFLFT